MVTPEQRQREFDKYVRAYELEHYAMGRARMQDARQDLRQTLEQCSASTKSALSYLDVACGRGEMVKYAHHIGFMPCYGAEVVPALVDDVTVFYGEAHRLPFFTNGIDVVTMFDAIEHFLPGDDEAACRELQRIAKHAILLTANNRPSVDRGVDLHVNRRPYDEWNELFSAWFADAKRITWIKESRHYISETWRIDL